MTLKPSTVAAYAAPCVPLACIGLPIVVYLPPYYAGTLGLDLATVGFLFFLVRIIDVPLDPLAGHFIDSTRTRFGRFRPWMAGAAVVMMIGVYLTFMAQPGITPLLALVSLLTMYLGYSSMQVAHTSWGAVVSDDYHERSRIFGWWQVGNMLGLIGILAVPPAAQYFAGRSDAALGVHAMGAVILVLLPLAVAAALARVPETPPRGETAHKLGDILAIARLPLLRRLLLVDILASLAPGLSGALVLFFFEAARGYPPAQASTLLLFYFVAGMVAAPLWVRVAKRTSKHQTMALALVSYAVVQTCTVLIPANNFALAAVGMALAGIPAVAPAFLARAMLADLSDAETLRTGEARTGLFFAALVAAQKLGYALPVGASYIILQAIGFVPQLGAGNTPAAISGLVWLFVLPPAVLAVLGALVVRRWPIDADEQARVARALTA